MLSFLIQVFSFGRKQGPSPRILFQQDIYNLAFSLPKWIHFISAKMDKAIK